MKIEDKRVDERFVDVRTETKIKIGDVVETENGRIGLIVWSDLEGRPYANNPGYNGLLMLDSNCHSYVHASQFPKVRKLNARLVIEKD